MKKIFTLFIITVMLLSVIPTLILADKDESNEYGSKGKNKLYLEDNGGEKLRERIKERINDANIGEDAFKTRILSGEKISEYKRLIELNEEKFRNSLIKSEKLKNLIEQNKEKLKLCTKGLGNSTNKTIECNNIKAKSLEDAREYLVNVIDTLTSHLESLKSQFESSEELSDAEITEKVEEIDSLVDQLAELKTKIIDADTKDELIALSKEVSKLFKDIKGDSLLYREKLRYGRLGEIIKRSESLEAQLTRIQDRYGQNISNNTDLNSKIEEFRDNIDEARTKYEQAKDKFEEARTSTDSEDKKQLGKEAHELLVEAQNDLKEAHNILKEIFRMLKGIDKDVDFNDDKCYENMPAYVSGRDLGYFVWQSTCKGSIFNVVMSGDARTKNLTNASEGIVHMVGTITTNGEFKDLELRRTEPNDSINMSGNNTINIDAYVSIDIDGIRFKTTGDKVTFDLMVDGEKVTDLVYIGKDAVNPSTIPFTLDVVAVNLTEVQCKEGKYLVNGVCKNTPSSSEDGEDDDGTDDSDDDNDSDENEIEDDDD